MTSLGLGLGLTHQTFRGGGAGGGSARLFTPSDLRMARSMIWYDPLDASTITMNGSNQVSLMQSKHRAVNATQSTDANKPVIVSDGLRFNASPAQLVLPAQGDAYKLHRWALIVCKVNIAAATAASGTLYRFNGTATSAGSRQPMGVWAKASNVLTHHWYANGSTNTVPFTVVDNTWLFLLSRIPTNDDATAAGVHYHSLNGGTESSAGTMVHMAFGTGAAGCIGHETANTFDWTLRHLLIGSEDLTVAEIERLQGWAAWEVHALNGGTMVLPVDHPYYAAAPTFSLAQLNAQEPSDRTTAAEFDALPWSTANQWTNTLDRTGLGTPTFSETFDADPRTDETIGAGPWFSPAISNTGNTDFVAKGGAGDAGSVSGSEYIIAPNRASSGSRTRSSSIQTVARNGRTGYVQQGGIWEAKVAFFDLNSVTNPEWRVAWWFKSQNFHTDSTVPYVEFDVFELYNREDHNIHATRWLHAADYPHNDDIQTDEFQSQQTSGAVADAAKWNIANLFDGVSRSWVLDMRDGVNAIIYFEDHEFARCPILPEWRVPWFPIFWCDCTTITPTTDTGPWDLMHVDFIKAWDTESQSGTPLGLLLPITWP